ncbi:MAG: BspA family leucine-rich repeat surface protein [Clostridiales bacterium]|nr:BspA family leucine-rich repeat surface protein [Clostridiales bacterium]
MPNHDGSTNYLAYPTLMPLPVQQDTEPDRESDQIQRLLAEMQLHTAALARIEAELQKHTEEMARMEAALQRLLAAQQTGNADSVRSRSQISPAPAQQNSHSNANSRPAGRAPRPQEKPTAEKKQNVLGAVGDRKSIISLDGITAKEDVTEIYFLNALENAPKRAVDLSAARDRSVLCWTEGRLQYIAGDGGVVGGKSCTSLFAGYHKMTAIHFDGNFDTSNVTTMRLMFAGCSTLTALDLSDWDTSYVMDMSQMFFGCSALTTLDLSGWNTSNVTNMNRMFMNCKYLTNFNPNWLDTSHADIREMYKGTRWR